MADPRRRRGGLVLVAAMSRTPPSVWAAIAAGKARLADRAEAERLAAAERDDEIGSAMAEREEGA